MLSINNLVKKFGAFTAVNQISLEVGSGEIYGFLGPNGAGKTTTIKIITGLYSPTSGRVLINGRNIEGEHIQAKSITGYIPDQPFLYEKLTGREFLYFSGGLYRMKKKNLEEKIEEITEKLQIGDWVDKRTGEYSQGMRQRITIASSLLHSPRLLVVDEPMVGLDPQTAVLVKKILKETAEGGAAVFMSTHSLSVAEEICSRIGIIKDGKMIFDGAKERIKTFMKESNSNFEALFLELTK